MPARPRRAAAQRANTAITDMVDSDNHTSSRTGRIMSSRPSRRSEGKSAAASVSRGPPSSTSTSNQHIHFTVKLPASKLRQATGSTRASSSGRQSARDSLAGGETVAARRSRSQKKSYVVETSDDDDNDEEEEEEDDADAGGDEDDDEDAEGEDDDMLDLGDGDEDAEGEIVAADTMDIDAEGEDDDDLGDVDAEGEDDDVDMGVIPPPAPIIKVSKPSVKISSASKSKSSSNQAGKASTNQAKDSDDDEELSELESERGEVQDTVKVGGGDDEDAEGEDEEIEEAGLARGNDIGSDDDGSRAETPDLTKMTKRQRARFEEGGDVLMKLSDEVQAKKHFTAEELSMRRAEMARRRRNLSDKRNEEVKMETINKLLKKQAPKTKGKAQLGDDQFPDDEGPKPDSIFIRWISNKDGSRVAVPEEMMAGPVSRVFVPGGLKGGKMVEEVS